MKLINNQDGMQRAVVFLSIVIVILIVFMGYLIYNAPKKVATIPFATTTSSMATNSGSRTTSTTSASGSATSSSGLQAQLNAIETANGSSTADLSSAGSALNDQSTFTGY